MIKNARTIMIYGESGSGKTSNLFELAKWYNKTTGKRVRLINCSGGGQEAFDASGLIDAGIVQLIDLARFMQNSEYKLAFLKRLAEGYWPFECEAGQGNFMDGNWYFKPDELCKSIAKDNIGMYQFEDMKSLGALLKAHLSEKEGGSGSTGFKHSFKIEEDGYTIGGLSEGHYGIIQNEIFKLVQMHFRVLPIDYFVMTSLPGNDGNDKRSPTMWGPSMVGSATAKEIPSWFGDCFYLRKQKQLYAREDGTTYYANEVICHFDDFTPEDSQIPFSAKIRIIPELKGAIDEKYQDGQFVVPADKGIMPLIRLREKLNREYRKKLLGEQEKGKVEE